MSEIKGIVNILKPPSMTSFGVVKWLRYILDVKKVGHTGTLDPLATGVLPICLGRATKVIPYLPEGTKEYIGELKLGQVTETLDAEGQIILENNKWTELTRPEIKASINKFMGKIKQIPPMYSAIKKNGKRLYKIAREGEEVEREPREVLINDLEILSLDLPRVRFRVCCSRGTYVRSLVRDIGEDLSTGAYLSFLLRRRSGPFNLKNSYSLKQIKKRYESGKNDFLLPLDYPLDFPRMIIKKCAYKKAINGAYLTPHDFIKWPQNLEIGSRVSVYTQDDQFISINEIDKDECRPLRVFWG